MNMRACYVGPLKLRLDQYDARRRFKFERLYSPFETCRSKDFALHHISKVIAQTKCGSEVDCGVDIEEVTLLFSGGRKVDCEPGPNKKPYDMLECHYFDYTKINRIEVATQDPVYAKMRHGRLFLKALYRSPATGRLVTACTTQMLNYRNNTYETFQSGQTDIFTDVNAFWGDCAQQYFDNFRYLYFGLHHFGDDSWGVKSFSVTLEGKSGSSSHKKISCILNTYLSDVEEIFCDEWGHVIKHV